MVFIPACHCIWGQRVCYPDCYAVRGREWLKAQAAKEGSVPEDREANNQGTGAVPWPVFVPVPEAVIPTELGAHFTCRRRGECSWQKELDGQSGGVEG